LAEDKPETDEPPPRCARCKKVARLVGIERADKPNYQLRTFECANCGHIETRMVCVH
jgi:hypothetical protein